MYFYVNNPALIAFSRTTQISGQGLRYQCRPSLQKNTSSEYSKGTCLVLSIHNGGRRFFTWTSIQVHLGCQQVSNEGPEPTHTWRSAHQAGICQGVNYLQRPPKALESQGISLQRKTREIPGQVSHEIGAKYILRIKGCPD